MKCTILKLNPPISSCCILRPGFVVLELFSGQGTHGKIVTRALWHTLKVTDANGGMFRPNVHLLRLDMHDNGNTELVSDVRDWNGDHIRDLKDIYKNKEVCT
jgi:hypothetical protein